MKCIVTMMQQETNTFSTLPTSLHAFSSGVGLNEAPSGQQAIDISGDTEFAFAALIDVPIAVDAEPSGKVEDVAFEAIVEMICNAVGQGSVLYYLIQAVPQW